MSDFKPDGSDLDDVVYTLGRRLGTYLSENEAEFFRAELKQYAIRAAIKERGMTWRQRLRLLRLKLTNAV